MTEPETFQNYGRSEDRHGLPGKVVTGRLHMMASRASKEDIAEFQAKMAAIEERERSGEAALRDIQLH